jgi:putative acetyltransferase
MFLLGHPSYYPRFGFVPAKPLGVRWAPDTSDNPNPAFMVKELRDGALAAALNGDTGVFHYAPAFDSV